MKTRLALAALCAAMAGSASAQPAPMIHEDLPVSGELAVTMMAFDVPPRGTAPATTRGQPGHRHPAAVYAYVATGEVISRLGEGPERRYRAGEAWSEKPNEAHYIVNASATEAARVVVTFIAPKTAKSLSEPLNAMKMR